MGFWHWKEANRRLGRHPGRIQWDNDDEEEKEAIATTRPNTYVSEELNRPKKCNEKKVCNKLDTIMKKGKSMYVNYTNGKEKRAEYTQDDVDIAIEVAKKGRPSFNTFFHQFKDHPALAPGAVE